MDKFEFLKKVKEMWETVDRFNPRLEMLIQVTEISEDGMLTDFCVESSNCLVCQLELLSTLVDDQGIKHCEDRDEESIH
jgi:hypothetical protein